MTLGQHTAQLKESGRKALVAFLTAGYPDDETFTDVVVAAASAGCDLVEVGIPFSDPIADGPVIQAASGAALAQGMTLARAIDLCRGLSQRITTPLAIMSYVNPILTYGVERFARDAANAGVSGVIMPDVSFEESAELRAPLRAAGLDYVDLLAPTSSDERIDAIARDASGFLYLVSMTGVTGARGSVSQSLPEFVARVRSRARCPLYVGFGVSTPAQAAGVAGHADGVIIGSQIIRLMGSDGGAGAAARVAGFIAEVRTAIDGVGEH